MELTLVLDLDETLVNSTLGGDTPSAVRGLLGSRVIPEELQIYRVGHEQRHGYVKLRPFVHEFLREASAMFRLYLYTMSSRSYACTVMQRFLDPSGALFGDRIIAREDHCKAKKLVGPLYPSGGCCSRLQNNTLSNKKPNTKDLCLIPAPNSTIVILDDSFQAWPDYLANLILVERYRFFGSRCRKWPALMQHLKDERAEDGILANMLDVLRRVHAAYHDAAVEGLALEAPTRPDVRDILVQLRKQTLAGCTLAVARGIPDHYLWQDLQARQAIALMARSMGAGYRCLCCDKGSVTHSLVFYNDLPIDPVNLSAASCTSSSCPTDVVEELVDAGGRRLPSEQDDTLQDNNTGKLVRVVDQNWLYAAFLTWKRPREDRKYVRVPSAAAATSTDRYMVDPLTFSTTIDLHLAAPFSIRTTASSIQYPPPSALICKDNTVFLKMSLENLWHHSYRWLALFVLSTRSELFPGRDRAKYYSEEHTNRPWNRSTVNIIARESASSHEESAHQLERQDGAQPIYFNNLHEPTPIKPCTTASCMAQEEVDFQNLWCTDDHHDTSVLQDLILDSFRGLWL